MEVSSRLTMSPISLSLEPVHLIWKHAAHIMLSCNQHTILMKVCPVPWLGRKTKKKQLRNAIIYSVIWLTQGPKPFQKIHTCKPTPANSELFNCEDSPSS